MSRFEKFLISWLLTFCLGALIYNFILYPFLKALPCQLHVLFAMFLLSFLGLQMRIK